MKTTREIKFRIPMECQNGHKSYWFYVLNGRGGAKSVKTASEYNPNCDCPKHNLWDGWKEVGQEELCANLPDRNGEEIYEGDVVKSEMWTPQVYQVGFNRGGFCFFNEGATYAHDCKYLESFEVIGNIYENPELLTQTQNEK